MSDHKNPSAVNWQDQYTYTKDRIVYTYEQHHIPGVHALARHRINNAIPFLTWHYHKNSFEFSIATKGVITFATEKASYKFSGGDVFVSFPNEIHGTDLTPITVGELYWFQLDISDPSRFLFLNEQTADEIILMLQALPHHVIQTDSRESHSLIKKAFLQVQNNESPIQAAAYLQLFLHLLIAGAKKEQFLLSPDIGKSLNYIMDNLTAPLDLEEVAAVSNLSLSQYKQKFKKQLGISPRRFINQQKIEFSKSLLLDGMPVTEVAMALSFDTSSYFSTVFKKYTRLTPREFLKKNSLEASGSSEQQE